ncbi:MarR family winged helix-turn-helix transcriptional regulator [Streptomyces montanisoli]|uniref:MarR family transcriptional regulator n=1 Tax=Streptomyces montanisoli TaxID=2798581 RepID=A0A940ME29_9ACTN|nr:MarR family transcriptional regulator [Streptomyces montanisoli]MBP0457887.1 MarR family transcriptional regulator [Streptomyces montanisoli]
MSEENHPQDHQGDVADFVEAAALLTIRYLTARDISFSAATTLSRLSRTGPARLTVLAAEEGASQPSMTQLVQRLERQGLVSRVGDPDDGRVVLVSITDAGRALLDERRRTRARRLKALLRTLSPEDGAALTEAARLGMPALRHLAEHAADTDGPVGAPPG